MSFFPHMRMLNVCAQRLTTTLITCALVLTLSGCNDGKSATAAGKITRYDEPGLTGQVLAEDTQQPLQGVIVFGFYATVQGSEAGGESVSQVLRSFETETDANGVFTLPAWSTGDLPIKGAPRSRFPIIGFYKDGYKLPYKTLGSIRQWYPNNKFIETEVTIKDNTYDWTARPHLLTPAKNEKERYNAIVDSNDGLMLIGECGWEQHAGLLLAQHVARKAMVKEYVSAVDTDQEGYMKSGRPRTNPHIEYLTRTHVDRLIGRFESSPASWKCANPKTFFAGAGK